MTTPYQQFAPRERPIIFSAPMVQAILDGRKTQTRRVMKKLKCPYGKIGDGLWVRETWSITPENDVVYRATDPGWDDENTGLKWRSPIHMSKKASRISLEITNVRIERLQEITDADAQAEGMNFADFGPHKRCWSWRKEINQNNSFVCPRHAFGNFINQLHGGPNWNFWYNGNLPDSKMPIWYKNPWVWVIEFKSLKGASDDRSVSTLLAGRPPESEVPSACEV